MKKRILFTALIFCSLLSTQAVELEKWSYNGRAFTPLGNVPSETGTGSVFGNTTSSYLSQYLDGTALIANFGGPPPSYFQGISHSSYVGSTSGAYRISFDIAEAAFPATGTGKAQFGWGLRSNVSGQDDCNALFRYDNGEFQLVVNDASGTKAPVTIATGSTLTNLSISMIFNLNAKGTPGSFIALYQFEGDQPTPIFSQQLALHDDFQVDEFALQFDMTSTGFAWGANDYVFFDNLVFETISADITLTNTGHQVSFIEDNGIVPNPSYEPGDVLEIVTENLNASIVAANNVTTSLEANPAAFSITPLSPTTFSSLEPQQAYTATYRVEILEGSVDGTNTFTVVNQIGTGADAVVFTDEIKQ